MRLKTIAIIVITILIIYEGIIMATGGAPSTDTHETPVLGHRHKETEREGSPVLSAKTTSGAKPTNSSKDKEDEITDKSICSYVVGDDDDEKKVKSKREKTFKQKISKT